MFVHNIYIFENEKRLSAVFLLLGIEEVYIEFSHRHSQDVDMFVLAKKADGTLYNDTSLMVSIFVRQDLLEEEKPTIISYNPSYVEVTLSLHDALKYHVSDVILRYPEGTTSLIDSVYATWEWSTQQGLEIMAEYYVLKPVQSLHASRPLGSPE